jgi:hypothetical protein
VVKPTVAAAANAIAAFLMLFSLLINGMGMPVNERASERVAASRRPRSASSAI